VKRFVVIVVVLALGGATAALALEDRAGAARWLDRAARSLGLVGAHEAGRYSGYVEADYVFVTSSVGGTLAKIGVARGDRVAKGTLLFALDDTSERAARDEAAAKLRQAEAQLADLQSGKRPPEIAAIEAQRRQATAMLRQSEEEYRRQLNLNRKGVAAEKALDDARAMRDQNRARVAELDAQLAVARMPARTDAIRAAEFAVTAAKAALAQAEWRLGQTAGAAPDDATVVDTLYRPGEMVPAGMPVVQLLPPANLKIRFFVPEPRLARLAVGDKVVVRCDGCGGPVPATVRFIAPQAEYTPPVIYSRDERARLVFMVEARPDARRDALRVGQPVDVAPAP
jgi:HlyD family secretion protein